MSRSYKPKLAPRDNCRLVRKHLAKAMIGRTVDLLVDAHTIVHGIVTGVLNDAGTHKLLVGGNGYDLNQILTATPASLDQQPQPRH